MAAIRPPSRWGTWEPQPRELRIQIMPGSGSESEVVEDLPDMRRTRWRLALLLTSLTVLALGTAYIAASSSQTMHSHVTKSTELHKEHSKQVGKHKVNTSIHNSTALTMLQFNPHWECFIPVNMGTCGRNVFGLIDRLLQNHSTDFANIIELPSSYRPPKGWQMACRKGGGGDTACILWRSLVWEVVQPHTECWWGNGRACNIMTFQNVRVRDLKVTVLGAHFPHGAGSGFYQDFVGTLRWNLKKSKNTTDKVILLADSNAGLHEKSDVGILEDLALLPPHTRVPTLWYDYRTCCYNIGFRAFFDRVGANFGKKLDLIRDDEYRALSGDFRHAPPFAQVNFPNSNALGAFHHPILAHLVL